MACQLTFLLSTINMTNQAKAVDRRPPFRTFHAGTAGQPRSYGAPNKSKLFIPKSRVQVPDTTRWGPVTRARLTMGTRPPHRAASIPQYAWAGSRDLVLNAKVTAKKLCSRVFFAVSRIPAQCTGLAPCPRARHKARELRSRKIEASFTEIESRKDGRERIACSSVISLVASQFRTTF